MLTLPTPEGVGFFFHPARVPRALANTARRGGLSRSVAYCRNSTRFRLPGGTVQGGQQDQGGQENIQGRIVVSIQHQSTVGADMGSPARVFSARDTHSRCNLGW